MERENQTLLDRIMAFEIDDRPKTLTFAGQLARENGWSVQYTRRVIDEYKRFVYLCMEAGHPCTPSDQVDQAWHLHLTYTRSYWERLCGETLPRPLHHNPTEGGEREDAKFDDWYARTLESYQKLFGVSPPGDIWPPSDVRFGEDPCAARVNLRRNWVVPKRRARFAGAGILLAAAIAGCGASGDGTAAVTTLFVFGGVFILLLLLILAAQNSKRNPNGNGSAGCAAGGGCGGGWFSGNSSSGDGGSSGCGGAGCGSGCGGD